MDDPMHADVRLTHEDRFRFRVVMGHGGVTTLITDEPPPLGDGLGPNPLALLAAAVGQCLASSLLFCMRRAHLDVRGLVAEVQATTTRNAEGRMRVGEIAVRLSPTVTPEVATRMQRCLEVFQSYCLVSESVRAGVNVNVNVEPSITRPDAGHLLTAV